jgi:hypothetical protein
MSLMTAREVARALADGSRIKGLVVAYEVSRNTNVWKQVVARQTNELSKAAKAVIHGDPTIDHISRVAVREAYAYTDDGVTKTGMRLNETATSSRGQLVPAEAMSKLRAAVGMPAGGIDLQLVIAGSAEDVEGPPKLQVHGQGGAIFIDKPTKKKMRTEREEKAAKRAAEKQQQEEKQREKVLKLIREYAGGYSCEHCDAIYHHPGLLQRHVHKIHPKVNNDDNGDNDDDDDDDNDDDDDDDDDDDNEDGNEGNNNNQDDGARGGRAAPVRQGGGAAPAEATADHDYCARTQATAARTRTKAEQDQQLDERRRALGSITISASSHAELTELLEGPFKAVLLPPTATEISREVSADGGTHRAVFARAAPGYRRGQARPPGERKGFTPTVTMLKLLLPHYHLNKHGSGISMYKLREELVKQVKPGEDYLIPTLEQLAQVWKQENERKNKLLLGIGSRVVVSNKGQSSSSSSSSSSSAAAATSSSAAAASSSSSSAVAGEEHGDEDGTWVGTVVARNKSHWYIRRDDTDEVVARQGDCLQLHASDLLFGEKTHGGRRKATTVT